MAAENVGPNEVRREREASVRFSPMIRFVKYTGAGNDFVVAVPGAELDRAGSDAARKICSRRFGVGVDGLILVYPPDEPDRVRVRFFNPDGSEFSTCGNGTRCAARFAAERGLVGKGPFTLVTSAGPIEARVDGDRVLLEYQLPAGRAGPIRVAGPWGPADGWLMHFGVPHFVLPVDRLPEGPIDEVCAGIRNDPQLGPEGANVNLIRMQTRNAGVVRTFERGVEGETLACGSGSMATVIAVWADGRADRSVRLDVRGGETLQIDLVDEPVFDGTPIRVRLAGSAARVFDGEFPGDASE
ncbi:MAG: diaminopimelate epimerase [Gemmatimonadota bacterium]|nr:diaminopimelate epimerase [Gemmatimonadota bacterium]